MPSLMIPNIYLMALVESQTIARFLMVFGITFRFTVVLP